MEHIPRGTRTAALLTVLLVTGACSDSPLDPGTPDGVDVVESGAYLPALADAQARLIPVVAEPHLRRDLEDETDRLYRGLAAGASESRVRDDVLSTARALAAYRAVAPGALGPDLTGVTLMLYRMGELVGLTPGDIDAA